MEEARLAERPSLTLKRFYPVASEKVWRAWTDPQALSRWFGPGGPQPVAAAELVFTHAPHFDETVRDNHLQGWSESFVKLEALLKEE
jgi:uncharacterized protein YndB with AHSA1/START domain